MSHKCVRKVWSKETKLILRPVFAAQRAFASGGAANSQSQLRTIFLRTMLLVRWKGATSFPLCFFFLWFFFFKKYTLADNVPTLAIVWVFCFPFPFVFLWLSDKKNTKINSFKKTPLLSCRYFVCSGSEHPPPPTHPMLHACFCWCCSQFSYTCSRNYQQRGCAWFICCIVQPRKIFIKGKQFVLWFFTFSASHWQPLYILKLYAVCYVCLHCTRDIRQKKGGFQVSWLTFVV